METNKKSGSVVLHGICGILKGFLQFPWLVSLWTQYAKITRKGNKTWLYEEWLKNCGPKWLSERDIFGTAIDLVLPIYQLIHEEQNTLALIPNQWG